MRIARVAHADAARLALVEEDVLRLLPRQKLGGIDAIRESTQAAEACLLRMAARVMRMLLEARPRRLGGLGLGRLSRR